MFELLNKDIFPLIFLYLNLDEMMNLGKVLIFVKRMSHLIPSIKNKLGEIYPHYSFLKKKIEADKNVEYVQLRLLIPHKNSRLSKSMDVMEKYGKDVELFKILSYSHNVEKTAVLQLIAGSEIRSGFFFALIGEGNLFDFLRVSNCIICDYSLPLIPTKRLLDCVSTHEGKRSICRRKDDFYLRPSYFYDDEYYDMVVAELRRRGEYPSIILPTLDESIINRIMEYCSLNTLRNMKVAFVKYNEKIDSLFREHAERIIYSCNVNNNLTIPFIRKGKNNTQLAEMHLLYWSGRLHIIHHIVINNFNNNEPNIRDIVSKFIKEGTIERSFLRRLMNSSDNLKEIVRNKARMDCRTYDNLIANVIS